MDDLERFTKETEEVTVSGVRAVATVAAVFAVAVGGLYFDVSSKMKNFMHLNKECPIEGLDVSACTAAVQERSNPSAYKLN